MNPKHRAHFLLLATLTSICLADSAQAHITGWITVDNNAVATTNVVTDGANSTTIQGVEGYQSLAGFNAITLADGQFIELTGTFAALSRQAGAATDLQRLRDQIRIGLFRAPASDPVQAENLTGYIIEHRNEIREIRNPILAPATNQTPFVSARSTAIGFSNAAPFGATGGNPVEADWTEEDLVTGIDSTLTITYRITRDGANLDVTGTIAGAPVTQPASANPPSDSDGAFLETFNLQNYNPAINLSGAGSDDFDFMFNRIGFLMGGNIDLNLNNPVGDFNADTTTDDADFAKWKTDFADNAGSDADADLDSDGADFLLWQQNHGRSVGRIVLSNIEVTTGTALAASASGVPEPSAAALFLLGGWGIWRRRRLAI